MTTESRAGHFGKFDVRLAKELSAPKKEQRPKIARIGLSSLDVQVVGSYLPCIR
jgi:hypothetical protein